MHVINGRTDTGMCGGLTDLIQLKFDTIHVPSSNISLPVLLLVVEHVKNSSVNEVWDVSLLNPHYIVLWVNPQFLKH